MLRSAKRVERLVIAALLAVTVFGFTAPRVLGMAAPGLLRQSTSQVRTIQVSNIAPGDSFSETMDFHNHSSRSLNYRVVFIRRGELWRCNPSGDNLHYEVTWSPHADQHLKPGETESATITVHFPLAASNECQGAIGRLLIRRGYIRDSRRGGAYECRPLPMFTYSGRVLDADDSLDGHICWELDKILHPLLRR